MDRQVFLLVSQAGALPPECAQIHSPSHGRPDRKPLPGSGKVFVGDAHDIGLGGLRLCLPVCAEPGSDIDVKVLYVEPPFEASGRVAWCNRVNDRYDVGIELTCWQEKDWQRVVEQICEIEQYRRGLLTSQGRRLSVAQAAKQWYAARSRPS